MTGLAPLLGALALGLVLGAFAAFQLADPPAGPGDALGAAVDRDGFQAVILSNDKLYFGRLEEHSDTFLRLEEAYFLRETREGEEGEAVQALLPVARELHGPENSMLIGRDEIVLVENLAADSPVLNEIRRQRGEE